MTTRRQLTLLAYTFYGLAGCFLSATLVVPGFLDILLATIGFGLAALGTVGLLAAAALGKGRVRHFLVSLLNDPQLVARLMPPRDELRRRIRELLRSYHGADEQSAAVAAAVEDDVIKRLLCPLRRDFDITVQLTLAAPEVVRISRTVSYVACRAEDDALIFGGVPVYGTSVEVMPEMKAAGFGEDQVARFIGMTVDGIPLVEGRCYSVNRIVDDKRVRIEVRSDMAFAESQNTARVSYTTETLAGTSDYMTFTMRTLVHSASLVVRYDPTALDVKLLALAGSEPAVGTKVIDLNGKVLVPGHTLFATWTKRPC